MGELLLDQVKEVYFFLPIQFNSLPLNSPPSFIFMAIDDIVSFYLYMLSTCHFLFLLIGSATLVLLADAPSCGLVPSSPSLKGVNHLIIWRFLAGFSSSLMLV